MDGNIKRKHKESASSAPKQEPENTELPFTTGGKCGDEIQLKFDDKKVLYVSKNFLVLSSPVFEAMFNGAFVEKKAECVPLPGKSYDDFLEFLLCINPSCLQDVNESNVLQIVQIAEEYQVKSTVAKSKVAMKDLVRKEFQVLKAQISYQITCSTNLDPKIFQALRNCLNMLQVASTLGYQDVVDDNIKYAAGYPSVFYGEIKGKALNNASINHPTLHSECKSLFEKLPADVRCQILSKRLSSCENCKFNEYTGFSNT